MRTFTVALASAAVLCLGMSSPMAQQVAPAVSAPPHPSITDSTPSHPSTTGQAARSPEVSRHGANQRAFCPPGQRKKSGKGSAFRC